MSRKAWTLHLKLQELKKYSRKTSGCGQPRGHLIRVLTERSVNEGGDFCDTVDRGLWLAILSSLLCLETDRNIRIGKQGYVFSFTDFKK